MKTPLVRLFGRKLPPCAALASALCSILLLPSAQAATEFQSTGSITISASGNAVPYPSVITVSGMGHQLTLLKVKLSGLSHALPQEMAVHLVSPSGWVRTLLLDMGGTAPLSGADLTFSDAAAQNPPTNAPLVDNAEYRSRLYPAGEPLPPSATDRLVSSLTGMGKGGLNGEWKLFVSDDSALNVNGGSLASWSLVVEDERLMATAPLSVPRRLHSATLLPDGRVLVAGGTANVPGTLQPVGLTTAELYDPASGTWRPTGSMQTGRYAHTASLLPNGLVLLAGGLSGNDVLASAELYDPATGEWSAARNLAAARRNHAAVVLPDRRVLVSGGQGTAGVLAGVEIYQPATGLWSAGNPLATARHLHAVALLADGRVLASGGFSTSAALLTSAEIYTPGTGAWSAAGTMGSARGGHTATLMRNDSVIALGGGAGGSVSAEFYQPALNLWLQISGPGTSPQGALTASLLPSGRLLAVGRSQLDLRLFNPSGSSWVSGGPLPEAAGTGLPEYHTATVLPSGRVLIAGGQRNGSVRADAFLYDPSFGAWTGTGALTEHKYAHRANLLSDGRVLASGGWNAGGITGNCQLYNPATGTWSNTDALNLPRARHTTTLMPWGTVLAVGGTVSGVYVADAEQFDPTANLWSTLSPPPSVTRAYHTATLLPDDRVLVVGGNGNGGIINDSAELYNPYGDTWTAADPLNTARTAHTATLLPDGRVFVAGGRNNTTLFHTAEIYDPATDTWSVTGEMHYVRYFHSALLLPSGKILVVGGFSDFGSIANIGELYDPLTGEWELTGQMTFAPHPMSLTLLPDGRVLSCGDSFGDPLQNAEIYDPATGQWNATASLAAARSQHSATRLLDGRILIAGGNDGAALTSSELYDPGQGFSPGDRPVVTVAAVDSIDRLVLTGDRFLGQPGASGGNGTADASTPYPQVQWHCLENGQTYFLRPDRFVTVTPGGFTTVPTSRGTPGIFLATVFANGIPSLARAVTPNYDYTVQPLELWRLRHFGNSANTGDGADDYDFERDTVPNLVEYGLGLHPRQDSAAQMPQWQLAEEDGEQFLFVTFPHPPGVTGVTYSAERSTSLRGGFWSPMNDFGNSGMHSFGVSLDFAPPPQFFRLRVSQKP